MRQARRIEAGLAVLAFLIAAYLTYERHEGSNALCPVGGGGCETVAHSSYSKFLGVPVSYFGMLGALVLLVLCLRPELLFSSLRFVVIGVGAAFSWYLTSLEATTIHAYCVWCLGSATIWTLLVVVAGIDLWRLSSTADELEPAPSRVRAAARSSPGRRTGAARRAPRRCRRRAGASRAQRSACATT